MRDVDKEVFKVRFKETLPCGGIVLALRVRTDNNWVFVNDMILHEGDSLIFSDNQEGEMETEGIVKFPRDTWTEEVRNETLDV